MRIKNKTSSNQCAVVHLNQTSRKTGLAVGPYIALQLDKTKIEIGSVHCGGPHESKDIGRDLRESRYTTLFLTKRCGCFALMIRSEN